MLRTKFNNYLLQSVRDINDLSRNHFVKNNIDKIVYLNSVNTILKTLLNNTESLYSHTKFELINNSESNTLKLSKKGISYSRKRLNMDYSISESSNGSSFNDYNYLNEDLNSDENTELDYSVNISNTSSVMSSDTDVDALSSDNNRSPSEYGILCSSMNELKDKTKEKGSIIDLFGSIRSDINEDNYSDSENSNNDNNNSDDSISISNESNLNSGKSTETNAELNTELNTKPKKKYKKTNCLVRIKKSVKSNVTDDTPEYFYREGGYYQGSQCNKKVYSDSMCKNHYDKFMSDKVFEFITDKPLLKKEG